MSSTKGIISIIDDRDDTRDSIKLLLESCGWSTDLHASAQGFLEELDGKHLPNAIVLNLDMLEKNSIKIQNTISSLEKNIPFIILAMDSEDPHAKEAADNGATVLKKPASGNEIVRVIEALV